MSSTNFKVSAFTTLNIDWYCPRQKFLDKNLTSQDQLRAYKYLKSFCKDGKTWRDTLSPEDFKFGPSSATLRRQRISQSRLQRNQTHRRPQSSTTLTSPDIITETIIPKPQLRTGDSAATAIDLTIEDSDTISIDPGCHTRQGIIWHRSRAQTKALGNHETTIEWLEDKCAKLEERCAKLEQKCQDLTEAYRCGVCWEGAVGIRAKLPCMHSFCKTCIALWSEKSESCPLCRAEFSSADIQHFYF